MNRNKLMLFLMHIIDNHCMNMNMNVFTLTQFD
jgi:hypothetical protein